MGEGEAEGVKLVCLSPENTDRGSMVEDFFAVVKGGSSESATALVAKKLPTPQLMNLWGDGVSFNPDFIRTTVSPLVFIISQCLFTLDFYSHSLCFLQCQLVIYCLLEKTFMKGFVTVPPGLAHWQEAKCSSSSSIDQVQKQTI